MTTYEELTSLMEGCTGSCCLWKRRPFANFRYTDGIKFENRRLIKCMWKKNLQRYRVAGGIRAPFNPRAD